MFAAVSLDGYVANERDEVGPLFDWYDNGDVPFTFDGDDEHGVSTTQETADFLSRSVGSIGSLVVGRRVFDITNGWNGHPPAGDHVYMVTHAAPTDWEFAGEAPFTFVTDGCAPRWNRPARPRPDVMSPSPPATSAARRCAKVWSTRSC